MSSLAPFSDEISDQPCPLTTTTPPPEAYLVYPRASYRYLSLLYGANTANTAHKPFSFRPCASHDDEPLPTSRSARLTRDGGTPWPRSTANSGRQIQPTQALVRVLGNLGPRVQDEILRRTRSAVKTTELPTRNVLYKHSLSKLRLGAPEKQIVGSQR